MRTSLNEIRKIDDYLHRKGHITDRLLFEAKTMLDKDLYDKVILQQKVYKLIDLYSQKELRIEIESAHQKLFSEPKHNRFKRRIMNIFFNDKH